MNIYYDSYNEGVWFRDLHTELVGATLLPFPSARQTPAELDGVLRYDRPDVVLVEDGHPILVVERTVEVPSGHNVGQRFARLVAAAQHRVPVIYFGPYAAYKHGGVTAGPRFMNLRLFAALQRLADVEETAVTTIRWPVDANYEIIQTPNKDVRMREYMRMFFDLRQSGIDLPSAIRTSEFEKAQELEREQFATTEVRDRGQYDRPPLSVVIARWADIPRLAALGSGSGDVPIVLYAIGMVKLRSDPYTGMAMLYAYLYAGGMERRRRQLILDMFNIPIATWMRAVARTPNAKHVRLYQTVADGILLSDGYVPSTGLEVN